MSMVMKSKESEKTPANSVIRLSKLPPFHSAALRLLNVSSESDSAVSEFEDAFSADPALTADLLLVANSAAFGLRSRVATIRHALAFLGLERVRSLASTIALGYYVRNMPRHPYLTTIWRHSVATAVVAESLGVHYRLPGLYTPGLMHDLGRLALLFSVGQEYADAMETEFATMDDANQSEKNLFCVTHCEAGASLAQAWTFPATLAACMSDHHDPTLKESDGARYVVSLSCKIADSLSYLEIPRADQQDAVPIPEQLRDATGLDPADLHDRIKKQLSAVG
jgi:HD-like signal output (HDOD) protein